MKHWKTGRKRNAWEENQLNTKGPVGSYFTTIISSCRLGLSFLKTTSLGLPSAFSLALYLNKLCSVLT